MQLSSVLMIFAFSATAFADMHYNAVCVDSTDQGQNVYNVANTVTACGYYFMRNKGDEWWNTCPDCKMITQGGIQLCNSAAQHIGGDEITYYCQLAGSSNALTS